MRVLGLMVFVMLLAGCASQRDRPRPPSERLAPLIENPAECGAPDQHPCLMIKVFDVGQGSSAIVIFPDGVSLLIDAGGSSEEDGKRVNDQINELIGPNDAIDYLVLSHSDKDHTNILADINRLIPSRLTAAHISGRPGQYKSGDGPQFFNQIYNNWENPKISADCNFDRINQIAPKIYCYDANIAGAAKESDGFPRHADSDLFTFLIAVNVGPDSNPPESGNEQSLVVGVSYGSFKIMFPGDAEGNTLRFIKDNASPDLWKDADVYVMAHHGSSTKESNYDLWLQALKPKVYITSSKEHRRWFHADGEKIHYILSNLTLKQELLEVDDHAIFSSSRKSKPTYCYCKIKKSFLTTYTNGTITFLIDEFGDFTFSWDDKIPDQLPVCPNKLIANYC